MLDANRDLARRIEQAECALLADAADATAQSRPDHAPWTRELGGGLAVFSGGASPLDKVAGLGFGELPSDTDLASVESRFSTAGVPVRIEASTLASPELFELLAKRGYRLLEFEHVLGFDLGSDPADSPPAAGIAVRDVTARPGRVWLDTIVDGFMNPDGVGVASADAFARAELEQVLDDMTSSARFTRYAAFVEQDAPAGAASMRVDGDIAQLSGAATVPAHRRRGVQRALLDHRLQIARRQNCQLAVVTTSPGSQSQRNLQRRGFALLYARAVLTSSS